MRCDAMRCQGRYETELSSTRAALDDAISQIALVRDNTPGTIDSRGQHAFEILSHHTCLVYGGRPRLRTWE